MPERILLILLFLFGTCIGSFINVLFWRLPRHESIVYKRSHCINCNNQIPWYLNIPIISWIYLRGHCHRCQEKISVRYPTVEFASGILFVLSYFSYPSLYLNIGTPKILIVFGSIIFYCILFSISLIDLKYLWIPSGLSKFGISTGLIYILIISPLTKSGIIYVNVLSAILCCISLILLAYLAELIFKKKALGMGDIKLFFLIGIWLSWPGIGITIYLSFIFSGIFVILGLLSKKIKFGDYIPFAPFISLSALLIWLLGNEFWINLYISKFNYLQ